jgi:hypothetical protein
MAHFEKLYNKVLSDAQFRAELAVNPSKALQSIGIEPTPQLLDAIKDVAKAVEEVRADLGPDIADQACVV